MAMGQVFLPLAAVEVLLVVKFFFLVVVVVVIVIVVGRIVLPFPPAPIDHDTVVEGGDTEGWTQPKGQKGTAPMGIGI